jgi:hypothetical protein
MASTNTAIDGDDDVYELSPIESTEAIPAEWRAPATYTLEMAVRCARDAWRCVPNAIASFQRSCRA